MENRQGYGIQQKQKTTTTTDDIKAKLDKKEKLAQIWKKRKSYLGSKKEGETKTQRNLGEKAWGKKHFNP